MTCIICHAPLVIRQAARPTYVCGPECRKVYARQRWHANKARYRINSPKRSTHANDGLAEARAWLAGVKARAGVD